MALTQGSTGFETTPHQEEEEGEEKERLEPEPVEDASRGSEGSLDNGSHGNKDEEHGREIEKVASKASVNNVAAIPNGGLQAWMQVLGAFMLIFNAWGIVNTYGVYQTYYENGELFQESSSNLSWIGALQACLLLLCGSLSGPIYDMGYFRLLIGSGTFLVVFGQMMLSLCTEYWQVLLAQAICMGFGAALLFVPGVAIVSTYFSTKIAFAVGVAATGSSLGGVIYPIVLHRLLPQIGFPWTARVIGFIELGTLMIPNLVMRVRVLPAQRRALLDWAAWKEPEYALYVFGSFLSFMGLYVPFFYIQFYSIATGITNENLGFYLIAILNSASIFGRTLPNLVADKIGPFNVIVPCAFVTSILSFSLIGIHSLGAIIVFVLIFGFFSGTFVSLPPAVFVTLSPTRGIIGTRMGMGFGVVSIGALIGTPIAGAILGQSDNPDELNFVGVWAYAGALTGIGAMVMLLARMFKSKWQWWVAV